MKSQTCCFTGHRKIPPAQYGHIAERLRAEIVNLIKDGVRFFGAGGALGFDTLAAQTVLSLKETDPQIKLILVLPCLGQSNNWHPRDIAIYEDIKSRCDKIVYTSREYTRDCMLRRNRHLVDNSGICVCYLTESRGGTSYTVNYAKSRGLRVINVADE